MTYFAEDILAILEKKLVESGINANLLDIPNKQYKVLAMESTFNENQKDKQNTIMLWSFLASSEDEEQDQDQIKIYCKMAENLPKSRIGKILEYLNYANISLDFGMLCIDNEGGVTYKYSYPVVESADNESTAQAVDLALGCAVFAMKTADMPLQKLINDSVTLDEAKNLLNILLEIISENT